uniref:Laminin subunit gamma-1 n=1 Tax=Lygus hesperus TaxID=30085 RepID=A0A0A9WQ07_LYGHE
MARDLNQMGSVKKSNEDVGAVFIQKLAEEKKIFDEAQALYNSLCANVEKSKTELTAIKMERFNLEGFVQESEIRIKVYEKWERDLRDEDERAKAAIKEAEIRQKEELEARDSNNKAFIKKVVELAEEYSRFKSMIYI